MKAQSLITMFGEALGQPVLKEPVYYITLPPALTTELRDRIETILRENISHRELQAFPELTDHMIDELEDLFNRKEEK